eukprot:15478109-Alexandrium_andersonii.AAC.1
MCARRSVRRAPCTSRRNSIPKAPAHLTSRTETPNTACAPECRIGAAGGPPTQAASGTSLCA